MNIGYNYRTLGYSWELKNTIFPPPPNPFYEKALNSFAKVTDINKQLGIKDPVPYIAISKTYAQMGEFLAASLNIQTALEYSPEKADIYGEAGQIFKRARNYESSELALQCAVRGCDPDVSCEVRQCNTESNPPITISKIDLTEGSKWYYLDYGSVLAALHRPTAPKCEEAMQVFKELRQKMSSDELAMSIVEQGESICQSYGY
jgi:tetratricopeptide (TPR) repeat protein